MASWAPKLSLSQPCPPIHRLPLEILVEIFLLVQGLRWNPGLKTTAVWLRLLRVCHHWKTTIEDCPVLWSPIALDRVPICAGLEKYLARSKDTLLSVSAGNLHSPSISIPQLQPHHRRIQFLDLDFLEPDHLPFVQGLLSCGLPKLSKLRLVAWPRGTQDESAIDVFPDGGGMVFPELSELCLCGVGIPSSLDISRIRKLELSHGVLDTWRDMPKGQFLDILERCTLLEDVWMKFSLPPHIFDVRPHIHDPNRSRMITLPRLLNLTLVDSPARISPFLSHVHVQPYVVTVLETDDLQHRHRMIIECNNITEFLPEDNRSLSILSTCTGLIWEDSSAEARNDDGGELHISLDNPDYEDIISSTPRHFASAPLRALHMNFEGIEHIPAQLYIAALDAFPTLATLSVHSHAVPASLLQALSAPSPRDSGRAVCPQLQHLELAAVFAGSPLLDEAGRSLRKRAESGCRLLSELRLELLHLQEDQACSSCLKKASGEIVDELDDEDEDEEMGPSTGDHGIYLRWRAAFLEQLGPFAEEVTYEKWDMNTW